jgi:hypothetical protein
MLLYSVRPSPRPSLVLVLARCLWELVPAREDHRSPVNLGESLGGCGGAVRSDGGTDGHEEAIASGVSTWPEESNRQSATYPNVAAEPPMYWPSVRSIPFGPGP